MPKLQSPLFSFEAHGALADTVAYKKRTRENLVISKPHPQDPDTLNQHQHRFLYTYWSNVWHFMTTAEKAVYKVPISNRHQTPYNVFMTLKLATPLPILAYLPMDSKLSNNPYCTYNRAVIGQGIGCIPAAGKIDGSMYYDGINDYSYLNTPITAVTAFSFSFWLRSSNLIGNHAILGRMSSGFTPDPFFAVTAGANLGLHIRTTSGISSYYIPTNYYYHSYALTWNGQIVTYYADSTPLTTTPRNGTLLSPRTPVYLACTLPPATYFANCYIDQIIYGNWCMSPQEVRAQHQCIHAIFRELDK